MSVVERPEVDFDQFSDEFGENRHAEWAKMRQCPVAHNSRYGGFWVVSGYDCLLYTSLSGGQRFGKAATDRARRAHDLAIAAEGHRHRSWRRVLQESYFGRI